jgi:creatinine amidohydrolase
MTVASLADLTWKDVAALVSPRLVALLPIGAIEAHGPHLPLSTDVIISEEMARRAAAKCDAAGRDVLILPSVSFSPARYAAAFAGTLSLTEATASAQVVEIAASLAGHGVSTLVPVNSHVDPANLAALRDACSKVTKPRVVFPDITRKPWVLRLPDEFKSGGAHAGFFETSLVMAARPSLVREELRRALPKVAVDLGRKIKEGAKTFHECGGPEAYFGDPASATAADGAVIYDVLAQIVTEAVLA